MAKNGFRILDSDMHIMEPPDLWERYLEPEFRPQAPRGVTSENVRDLRMQHPDGRLWGLPDVHAGNVTQGHNFKKNQGIYGGPRPPAAGRRRSNWKPWTSKASTWPCSTPREGSRPSAKGDMEPRFAAALARAYNNWLHDFCSADPARLLGAGMISPFDRGTRPWPRSAGAPANSASGGIFMRSNPVNGRNFHDDYYEPLWSELEDLGMPLGLHESSSSGRAAGGRPVRAQLHAPARVRPTRGADARPGQHLRGAGSWPVTRT